MMRHACLNGSLHASTFDNSPTSQPLMLLYFSSAGLNEVGTLSHTLGGPDLRPQRTYPLQLQLAKKRPLSAGAYGNIPGDKMLFTACKLRDSPKGSRRTDPGLDSSNEPGLRHNRFPAEMRIKEQNEKILQSEEERSVLITFPTLCP